MPACGSVEAFIVWQSSQGACCGVSSPQSIIAGCCLPPHCAGPQAAWLQEAAAAQAQAQAN